MLQDDLIIQGGRVRVISVLVHYCGVGTVCGTGAGAGRLSDLSQKAQGLEGCFWCGSPRSRAPHQHRDKSLIT